MMIIQRGVSNRQRCLVWWVKGAYLCINIWPSISYLWRTKIISYLFVFTSINNNFVFPFHVINCSSGRHIIETVSELIYTPKNEREYGTLACWARNSIGKQTEPCLFQVVPAGNHLNVFLPLGILFLQLVRNSLFIFSGSFFFLHSK